MPTPEKVDKVREIKERLEAAEAALFADYRGLTVQDIGEVRGSLVDVQAQLAVVKNTLARLAVREAGLADLEAFLEGPTAIAFIGGDPVAGAKAVVDASKRYPVLEVKGGLAEGRVLTAEQVRELASLDTREEMLAKVAGLFGLHMSRAAYVLQALQVKLLRLLDAYKEKLPGAEVEEAPSEGPSDDPAEAPSSGDTTDGSAEEHEESPSAEATLEDESESEAETAANDPSAQEQEQEEGA